MFDRTKNEQMSIKGAICAGLFLGKKQLPEFLMIVTAKNTEIRQNQSDWDFRHLWGGNVLSQWCPKIIVSLIWNNFLTCWNSLTFVFLSVVICSAGSLMSMLIWTAHWMTKALVSLLTQIRVLANRIRIWHFRSTFNLKILQVIRYDLCAIADVFYSMWLLW